MNYLKQNLRLLNEIDPLLSKRIEEASSKTISGIYNLTDSRCGLPTISINNHYIHSRFDPLKESSRFIGSQISPDASLYVMGGFGLGYHIDSLLSLTENETIIIVEPDTDLFVQAIFSRDLTPLFHSGRLIFLIGNDVDNIISVLEKFPGKLVQLIILRSLYEHDQQYYDALKSTVRNYISRKKVNLSTLKRFGKLWLRNLSENAYLLARAPGIETLKNRFNGYPALLIAAGPSLDGILPHLETLKDRFLIVAVDTALKACLRSGVEPDFTIVADPQYWNSRHLDRCFSDESILISDTSTFPSVFRQMKGKHFLCSSPFPLSRFLEEKTEIKGKLKAGGSVATAAWDFCRILGVDSIYCAGLDLAFPGKQTHYKGSFFEQRVHWLSQKLSPAENTSWHALIDAGLYTIESNSGRNTWSDNRMTLYIKWFEEQMLKYPQIQSYNLSEEGVKIRGMNRVYLKEILRNPSIRSEINTIINEIRNINVSADLTNCLKSAIDELINELSSLKSLGIEGLELSDQLAENFKQEKDMGSILDQLNIIDEQILKKSGKDIAAFILQDFINEILKDNKSPEPEKIIENSRTLYRKLKESIIYNLQLLEKARKKIKKSQV